LERKVAIKVLNPQLTRDEQFRQRFVNEARIQGSLRHPNIVGLHSFFEQDGIYYMVLEFAPGRTLKDLIAAEGPLSEARARKILAQILDALAYAHDRDVIHRDIKPSNIMIDKDDRVKVMDFGIARIMSDGHLTKTGFKLGTLYYMSPEQILTPREVDHRTDIFSAGIVLYEMLTGRLPYNTDTDSDFAVQKEIVDNKLPDPRQVDPQISEQTVHLLNRMTSKDKDDRPNSIQNLDSDHELSQGGFYRTNKNAFVQKQDGTDVSKAFRQSKWKKMRFISAAFFGMVLLAFLLPFFTIEFERGQGIVSGYKLALKGMIFVYENNLQSPIEGDNTYVSSNSTASNVYCCRLDTLTLYALSTYYLESPSYGALIALAAALFGLVVCLLFRSSSLVVYVVLIACIGMISQITLLTGNILVSELGQGESCWSVSISEVCFGFYLALASFLMAVLFAFLSRQDKGKRTKTH
jgi:serine/threonine protein kinase